MSSAWCFRSCSLVPYRLANFGSSTLVSYNACNCVDSNCLCDQVPIQMSRMAISLLFQTNIGDQLLGLSLGFIWEEFSFVSVFSSNFQPYYNASNAFSGEAPCSITHLHSGRPSLLSSYSLELFELFGLTCWITLNLSRLECIQFVLCGILGTRGVGPRPFCLMVRHCLLNCISGDSRSYVRGSLEVNWPQGWRADTLLTESSKGVTVKTSC